MHIYYCNNNKQFINQYDEVPELFLNTNNPSLEIAASTIPESLIQCINIFKENESNIYIPLSSGMDSRLIATFYLGKDLSHRIICYSYGSDIINNESSISRAVAQPNLKWEFIEYKISMWRKLRKNYSEIINKYPVELCFQTYKNISLQNT